MSVYSTCREEGLVALAFVMAEDHVSVTLEPGMGCKLSVVTRDADSKLRGNSSPAEEPGQDKSGLEAGGSYGSVSPSDLYQPSQA
jgi:hypothetical protein